MNVKLPGAKSVRLPRLPRAVRGAAAASMLAAATCAVAIAAAPAPGVWTGGVSAATANSVVLHGTVNPKGLAASYVFKYGPTAAYGAQTPLVAAGAGTATVLVSQAVMGLQPYTIYHYRILATGPGGTRVGSDRSFKTARVPLSLQIAASPNPVSYGDPFDVQGSLSGTGAAGHAVALQIDAFPYTHGFVAYGAPQLTNAAGSFSFPVIGLLENAQLRVVTITGPRVISPVLLEGVSVRVTLHARRVRHHRGRFFRLYGSVDPAEIGASVGFQWLRPGRPSINQGGAFVEPGRAGRGHFSAIVRIRHNGLYTALVVVKDGSHVSAYSAPIRIG
jgi:hypothetical protein